VSAFPTRRAAALETVPPERRWLIEGLWSAEAVGIVGGEPKCCKSFLALDTAVSVASGAPCLRRFKVAQQGTVLLFAAEDALHVVRSRLEGICASAGVALDDLPIEVITVPTVRLDLPDHQRRLGETVQAVQPRLLVLDPFVRLHRVDENAAAEVAPLLAYLREIQRQHGTAVVLVHHARKGAGRLRAGQALRGSSELHAWGDSNLYLRRKGDALVLSIEHRAAPSPKDLHLALRDEGPATALHVVDAPAADERSEAAPPAPEARVLEALAAAEQAMSAHQLREASTLRSETFWRALGALVDAGRVRKVKRGYVLVEPR
jgi:hypothetical protein